MTHDRTTDTAGAGSPAPAVPSAPPDAAHPPLDVVAPQARTELDRIRRRWGELPLVRAESGMPLLRALLNDLAPRSARPLADPPRPGAAPDPGGVGDPHKVPDLGPAVVVDQLDVLVWDAYAVGHGDGIPALLSDLRRALG